MKMFSYLVLAVLFILSCKDNNLKKNIEIISVPTYSMLVPKVKQLTKEEYEDWYHKDIIKDTIPGISLNKAYTFLIDKSIRDTIIVAILDSPIDNNHEDLKQQIWINKNEIPNNGIDDDDNGYIDDIQGWNFTGSSKGEQVLFSNYEFTRILRKYDSLFNNTTLDNSISSKDSSSFQLYSKANKKFNKQIKLAIEDTIYGNMLYKSHSNAKNTLKTYFPNHNYTISSLDSLKLLYPKDTLLQRDILRMSNFIKYDFTEKYITNYKLLAEENINKLLNLSYNDRTILGDNSENLLDHNYGNNIVNQKINFFEHSTIVSGVIGAKRNNNIGIDGVANVKIMPVCISVYGDEHDKDIALAIKYAVDNGAKVINMSFGKLFSLNKKWVDDAFKYAEKNNVLIVSSAGNNHFDLNKVENEYYPNDNINNGSEISSNFMMIGASSDEVNENLITDFSNYGNIDVDVFAPGDNIKTTLPENSYTIERGTSISTAIVSGIAALVWSYYPDLSAAEMKNVLMQSGNSYNINVEIKQEDGTKKTVPFSELSKSGKIVNAYNALLIAEQISNNKK
ncbi:S8 family serine peptidase [Aquimarina sp. RZ0]|uniref:S8 family serine peptidase n=1 Tax=Aquimarina sp. RZ0 TaxID=2607730 RepID=UPI00165F9245|nr:S8 family serine peptidase [Aquimarina sp. RZ0]